LGFLSVGAVLALESVMAVVESVTCAVQNSKVKNKKTTLSVNF
jgi:hypothetical protein